MEAATDSGSVAPAPGPEQGRPRILIIEPDADKRRQVSRGLAALGYRPDAFATIEDVPWSLPGQWAVILTGAGVSEDELARLGPRRAVGSDAESDQSGRSEPADERDPRSQPWSEEFKIKLLQWVADEGPVVLRPLPCPDAPLGHAYPRLETRCNLGPGEAVRVLEDLADHGVLTRRLANRVHLCPNCRRWTINFRETCPNCSSLDVNVEELIHHFTCAYIGLDGEYRDGSELRCPKCHGRLNHIGVDYERPRQTYVCYACQGLFEEPVVTAQCLACRWEGGSSEILDWTLYEYDMTERGREAVDRGELRGLRLREMIRTGQYELASREFFELEVEREMFRLQRYGRPMSILICRFLVDDVPFPVFYEADRETMREFARLITGQVRMLDVAALADARTIAILLPETKECDARAALTRLRGHLDCFGLTTADGKDVDRQWTIRSWSDPPGTIDEALLWFQQQLSRQPDEA